MTSFTPRSVLFYRNRITDFQLSPYFSKGKCTFLTLHCSCVWSYNWARIRIHVYKFQKDKSWSFFSPIFLILLHFNLEWKYNGWCSHLDYKRKSHVEEDKSVIHIFYVSDVHGATLQLLNCVFLFEREGNFHFSQHLLFSVFCHFELNSNPGEFQEESLTTCYGQLKSTFLVTGKFRVKKRQCCASQSLYSNKVKQSISTFFNNMIMNDYHTMERT